MTRRSLESNCLLRRWTIGMAFVGLMLSSACSVPASAARSAAVGAYEVEILVNGVPGTVYQHRGNYYVAGQRGQRYEIRVTNHTGQRVEAVVSVDGRDVIDGRPASTGKRGYLIDAYGSATIDGFRTSTAQVAAFRFSSVDASYAARMGNAANVGIIGAAFFPERHVPQPIAVQPPPPPPYDSDSWWARRSAGADKLEAESASPAPSVGAVGDASTSQPRAAAEAWGMGGAARQKTNRPGLGTSYGEQRWSPVQEVAFVRANSGRPAVTITMRYNDWDGLIAAGVVPPPDPRYLEEQRRVQANPFPADGRFSSPPPGGQW